MTDCQSPAPVFLPKLHDFRPTYSPTPAAVLPQNIHYSPSKLAHWYIFKTVNSPQTDFSCYLCTVKAPIPAAPRHNNNQSTHIINT